MLEVYRTSDNPGKYYTGSLAFGLISVKDFAGRIGHAWDIERLHGVLQRMSGALEYRPHG